MCRIFYIISIIASLSSVLQAQTFQSVFQAGGIDYDVGTDVVVDNQGNIFMSGFFSLTSWFDSSPLTSNGCFDPYLVKLSSDGDVLWTKGFGYTNCDYTGGLCIDNEQNVYISGLYQIELNLGDTILFGEGGTDGFIAKFDNDGNFNWAKQIAGPGSDSARNLIHKDGNVYMSGTFSETASIDGIDLISAGSSDSFVLKLNTAGDVIWIKQGGGTDHDMGLYLDVDDANNVYLSGRYGDSASFGNFETISNGQNDVFICKYDQDGTEQWLKGFGSTSNDFSGCLALDNFGNIYFTGNFNGDFSVDMQSIMTQGEFVILKFDLDGNLQWVRQDECSGQCAWTQFVIDDFDNIFLAGKFSNQAIFDADTITVDDTDYYAACFAQIDENGTLNWLNHTNMGSCSPSSMRTLNDSTLIVTGVFSGSVNFDDITINTAGGNDIFLTTLSNGSDINLSVLSDPPLSSECKIYPNPTNHIVTLEFEDPTEKTILLYSPMGDLLNKEIFHSRVLTIDLSLFDSGVYVLQVLGQNYQKVAKIIKE